MSDVTTTEPSVEDLRRKVAAAKSLLSRRYNEMENCQRSSTKTFADYLRAAEAHAAQSDVFQTAVKAWKAAIRKEE